MTEIEYFSDANSLIEAFDHAKKGSDWKESVQRYEMNLLKNVRSTQLAIRGGTYQQKPFVEFTLNERGKTRPIKSMHISDRVVQRSLCDNILVPHLYKYLIYDNGASVKDKGISFARSRAEAHLHKFYREHGNDGYALLIDFSKYFDNIPHKQLAKAISEKVTDPETMAFVRMLIDTFRIDVSYMSDEEYQFCEDVVFNSLDHFKIDRQLLTGEKFLDRSVGIGSQISQICGVFYPTRIDTYCKNVLGLKYYSRYMDDTIIIHESKEYLRKVLEDIGAIAKELGIFVNMRKTHIVKLSRGFTFLKIKYTLTDSGRLVRRLTREVFVRERRRLKSYKTLTAEGKITYKVIEDAYKSWRGNVIKYNSRKSVKNMDKLYNSLFIQPFIKGEKQ